MTPERWQQVEKVFHGALEREPRERAVFLEQACGEDTWLRNKIDALLRSHTRILETVVFILANTEERLSAALEADGTRE